MIIYIEWGGLTKQRLVRAKATTCPDAAGNAALDENAWWYCGLLWIPDLDQDEGD
jgi:hypothetical protein